MNGLESLHAGFPALPHGMSAANASHRLNKLLTVVFGSLEPLQRQALDERGKAQLHRAQSALSQAA